MRHPLAMLGMHDLRAISAPCQMGNDMKKVEPKTRGPTEKELREFASWCATARGNMKDSVYDWSRFGKCVEAKAQELFRPKCIECGK